jgi:hypothetical protein
MATTLVSTGVQFPNGTIQTTAATASPSTAGVIGAYSMIVYVAGSAIFNNNYGGNIAYSDSSGNAFSGATGTWKCMAVTGSGADSTVFLRIA